MMVVVGGKGVHVAVVLIISDHCGCFDDVDSVTRCSMRCPAKKAAELKRGCIISSSLLL